MADINELLLTNPAARPTDQPATRDIDAPPGVGHLENFGKLISLLTPEYGPQSASIITDDAVLLDAGHAPPAAVGTLDGPAATSRATHAFTAAAYTAGLELAPRLSIDAPPFDAQPAITYNSHRVVSIGLSVRPDAVAHWPGYVLALFASRTFCAANPYCPAGGHLIPLTSQGRLWLPTPPDDGAISFTLASYLDVFTGATVPLVAGERYYCTVYLTRNLSTVLSRAPGATRNRLSYPSATLTWDQT